jgi:hypothetical protein
VNQTVESKVPHAHATSPAYDLRPRHQAASTVIHGFRSAVLELAVNGGQRHTGLGRHRLVGLWTDEQLAAAMRAVDLGEKVQQVARLFDIVASSLFDHINGKTLTRKRGQGGVLSVSEEEELVAYTMKMADLGHLLSVGQLKIKATEITQERPTPYVGGVLGTSWLKWFRHRHPELTLRSLQGLEISRTRRLCPENVASLYHNLRNLYEEHHYPHLISGIVMKRGPSRT